MTALNCFKRIIFPTEFDIHSQSISCNLKIVLWILLTQLMVLKYESFSFFGLLCIPLFLGTLYSNYNTQNSPFWWYVYSLPILLFTIFIWFFSHSVERDFLLFFNLFSLCAYSIPLSLVRRNKGGMQGPKRRVIVICVCALLVGVGLFAVMENPWSSPLSWSPNLILGVLLVIALSLVLKALIDVDRLLSIHRQQTVPYNVLDEGPTNRSAVMVKIEQYFNSCEDYLEPSFDLDKLSRDIQVPKAEISVIINKEMNKNFYALLGEYRIRHAKTLLIQQDHLFKIETVIYDCGFNSKSSFHKHFKQLVGTTPSTFRSDYFLNLKTSQIYPEKA